MEESLESRIANFQNVFSRTDKIIAKLILENKVIILDSNVSQIASLCGVSDASVVRFAKKIGYTGYYQLKLSLATSITIEDTIAISRNLKEEDPLEYIYNKVTGDFRRTIDTIDREEIKRITSALLNAGNIVVVGGGSSFPVALDITHKLSKLGLRVFSASIPETMVSSSRTLGEGDLLFAVSHSGESQTVYQSCNCAKENGAEVLLMTNYSKSPLTPVADYILKTNVYSDPRGGIMPSFSRVCESFVNEFMFLLIERELDTRSTKNDSK